MSGQTAVVIGSTGMIGELVVKRLMSDPAFTKIRLLVRKPVPTNHEKIEVSIVNFDDPGDVEQKLGKGDFGKGDSIFCCVGTTQSKVKGDNAAYRKVDFDLPVNAARLGLKAGFTRFLLVSAIGANPGSGNFYLRLKGETEEALKLLQYPSLHIFQPSLLLGSRKEFRLAERFAQAVMPALGFLLPGKLRQYKAIEGADVARAMVNAAKSDSKGVKVYTYEQMMAMAAR